MLEEHKLLFFLLTETWLREHLDAELHIENYTLFRVDRSRKKKRHGRNSGGVAAYIRSDLVVKTIFEYSSGVVEALCFNLVALNLIVCVVYRQPDDLAGGNRSTETEFSTFISRFSAELTALPSPTPNIILAGDLNLPHASWPTPMPGQGATPDERNMLQALSALTEEHFLVQINREPTHQAGNILDVLLTNCQDNFTSIETIPSAPISSHHLVRYSTLLSAVPSIYTVRTSDNKFEDVNMFSESTNWSEIRAALRGVDWEQELANKTASEILQFILSKCGHLAQVHAPKRTMRKKCPRIPHQRRTLMRRRTRIRKSYCKATNSNKKTAIQSKLVDIERKLQESHHSQEKYEEEKAVRQYTNEFKIFLLICQAKVNNPVASRTPHRLLRWHGQHSCRNGQNTV